MSKPKLLYKCNGSITLFVLISMIFFVTILTTAYVSLGNKQQAQRKETEVVKEQYDKTDNQMQQIYSQIAKSYPRIMLRTGDTDVEYSVKQTTEENLKCSVAYASELNSSEVLLISKSNVNLFEKYTDEFEVTDNCNLIAIIGNVIDFTDELDLDGKYISIDNGQTFVLYDDTIDINEESIILELTDKKTIVSITNMI